MRKNKMTLGETLDHLRRSISMMTLSQMEFGKKDEITLRNDGYKTYVDVKTCQEHHSLKIPKKITQSS